MSSREQLDADNGQRALEASAPPDCPRCKRAMTVKQVSPTMRAADLDEMVYGCDECGTEIKRTIKRS
jgi:transposase-like protein